MLIFSITYFKKIKWKGLIMYAALSFLGTLVVGGEYLVAFLGQESM